MQVTFVEPVHYNHQKYGHYVFFSFSQNQKSPIFD